GKATAACSGGARAGSPLQRVDHGRRHACRLSRGARRQRPEPGGGMTIVYFTHSLESCWNHGNAHFLRGVLRELIRRGHGVRVFEPVDAWSRDNLVRDHGEEALSGFAAAYPELASIRYGADADPAAMVDGADLVIV